MDRVQAPHYNYVGRLGPRKSLAPRRGRHLLQSPARHEAICQGDTEKVTVTGTVKEKEGKNDDDADEDRCEQVTIKQFCETQTAAEIFLAAVFISPG